MSRVLHVLKDPPLDGPTNMARDEYLLHCQVLRPAVVRLYAWTPPTISLGYFQRFEEIDRLAADVRGLAVVRRITGGGAILHDCEVTYCLVVDDSLPVATRAPVELYRLVHECWRDAVAGDGPVCELAPDSFPLPTPRAGPFFCFERPGRTDLVIGERKLLGSAQRRIPGAVLQHGSLLLGQRFASHPGAHLGDPDEARVSKWSADFVRRLGVALRLECQPAEWSTEALADIATRRGRYAGEAWTKLR